MTPTIRIDDELYEFLKERAEPFVDTPNVVLRRLLGLTQGDDSESSAAAEKVWVEAPNAGGTQPRRRRQSRRTKRSQKPRRRAPRGTLLPQAEYELPLLRALEERGGRAPSKEAIDAVGAQLDGKLTKTDREQTSSGGVRWRNRAQFARLALVERGDMKADSPRGVWELTEQGTRRALGKVSAK